MYVVTFYSFKGGVGRTMGLVNIAFELASKGRNVLVVDFDLEAPGLSTYAPFLRAAQHRGLVDYVAEFTERASAPNVADFIVECSEVDGITGRLCLMPAGKRNDDYAGKLAGIDWQALYHDYDGYLMFEDLKQQWGQLTPHFDYVLVDSRTGHTDVGGICTRQLPDAVVAMFYPNEQNLLGLESVVRDIREDGSRQNNPPKLLFCPSNVPDLDDENEVLEHRLTRARRLLDYRTPATIIHHYDSLDLLEQSIFVKARRKTRLAEEYRTLTQAIIRTNLLDRDGALAQLSEMRAQLSRRGSSRRRHEIQETLSLSDVRERLTAISRHHVKDGEIAWSMAAVSNSLGDAASELESLTQAIHDNYRRTQARLRRADILLSQGSRGEAVDEIREIVASSDIDAVDFYAAVATLRRIDSDWLDAVRNAPTVEKLTADDLLSLVQMLEFKTSSLAVAEDFLRRGLSRQITDATRRSLTTELSLILIGLGRFGEAMQLLSPSREGIMVSLRIADVFNYAMAEWGYYGVPPKDLFQKVKELDGLFELKSGVNYFQCMALTSGVLEDQNSFTEALERARVETKEGEAFSCWRYLRVNRQDMLVDLASMESAMASRGIEPAYIARSRSDAA